MAMDWTKCVVCGEAGGDLRCPLDSLQGNGHEVYSKFLIAVKEFEEIDALPVKLTFNEDLTTDVLVKNRGMWHRSCYLKFNSTKLQRAKQGRKRQLENSAERRKSKRQNSSVVREEVCIFCSEEDGWLHQCSTMSLDRELRKMAIEMQDAVMLSKISGGDLVAIEAKYHLNCLVSYRNKYRSMQRATSTGDSLNCTEEPILQARAFADLVSHIESSVDSGVFIFKLSELSKLYENHLLELGIPKGINKTRLKLKLLGHFSDLCKEETDGKHVLLAFNQGLHKLFKDFRDFDSEALLLSKISKMIRKEMFEWNGFSFSGTFSSNCQNESVPTMLKSLVSMLLYGQDISDQHSIESQACLTISQLIYFHAKTKKINNSKTRHIKDREPPLPIYLGLQVHTQTRSKKLINILNNVGISISYNRVMELEGLLAGAVCTQFEKEGIVCPPNMRKGLFTAGALDNIDHNPSSTTAEGSFHGTGISLFQFPSMCNPGISRDPIVIDPASSAGKCCIPDAYATVSAVACRTDILSVPESSPTNSFQVFLDKAVKEEFSWLDHCFPLLQKDILEKNDYISWASFHASIENNPGNPSAIIALLPLFYEKAASLAMIKHGMDIQKKITEFLNPTQIPVMAFDQPLFALAKYVQWKWPDSYGENKFVVMFGGLHIEMALWSTIGEILDSSGWTTALCDAGVASPGIADSFLKASHLTRTRHAHQVTLIALSRLQRDAWQNFISSCSESDQVSFKAWREDMISKSPTFRFWDIILNFEMMVLVFIRAHRTKNFKLYVETLEQLVPWFLALDRINYARWIPIHIRDMKSIPASISEEFERCWVVQKTQNVFSCMPLDQAHEQNNELVKGSGGAVGLTENPTAFRRWMVAGPEQARLLKEFENEMQPEGEELNWRSQHEQCMSIQERFKKHVCDLCETITTMGNPFLDDCQELLVLDSRNCASENVASTVQNIKDLGKSQYTKYVEDVITSRTVSIHEVIKKNFLPLFKRQSRKQTKVKDQISSLKSDCNLFSHLYIASKFRDGSLVEFFAHENHPWPPSLSDHGKLRLPTKKSDLLSLIDSDTMTEPPSSFDAKLMDGPAIVHLLSCKQASTFADYSKNVFIAWIEKELQNSKRIDIIWDVYKADSLKDCTRQKRGKGIRRKVSAHAKVPGNFQDFLRDVTNKKELFDFLSCSISSHNFPTEKEIYVTSGRFCIVI